MSKLNKLAGLLVAPLLLIGASAAVSAEEVGQVGVDWLGNDIVVDAVQDPKVQGVTCYLASFSRGMIDRLQKAIGSKTRPTLRFPVSSLVRLPLATSSLAKAESGSSQNARA